LPIPRKSLYRIKLLVSMASAFAMLSCLD
jgi:hypothetical protein